MALFVFSLFIFGLGLFFQARFSGRIIFFRILFIIACAAVILFYLAFVFLQYRVWQGAGPPSSYLVPPHRSVWYVFSYHFFRFLLWYVVSAGIALFVFFSMRRLNARSGDQFFEREEPYLAALSIFLSGNPAWNYAWIYYFFILSAASALGIIFRRGQCFSLYWLWIPCALGGIIVANVAQYLIFKTF